MTMLRGRCLGHGLLEECSGGWVGCCLVPGWMLMEKVVR